MAQGARPHGGERPIRRRHARQGPAAQLVGVIRPIDVPEIVTSRGKDGEELVEHKFRPLVGETGKPVVRAITEADIDAIGPAVLDTILYG